jgi:hypothetical protein
MRNHVLNWSPGKLGKGLLMNDGSVHTWVDGEHAPQHDQYWAEKELDGEPDLRFFIGPDGYLNDARQLAHRPPWRSTTRPTTIDASQHTRGHHS